MGWSRGIGGALACVSLLACSAETPGEWRGSVLSEPIPRPSFTLPDTDGRPWDFAAETRGKLALLFFGYTNCPDVCPVHMANLAAVLDRQPYEVREQVVVIFVTTDPARDTPERIRSWLDGFSTGFVGLRGDLDVVNGIQESLGLGAAEAGEIRSEGDYDVGHAAGVLAFPPGGPARLMYFFGTRQADWEHDLPRLLRDAS